MTKREIESNWKTGWNFIETTDNNHIIIRKKKGYGYAAGEAVVSS